MKNEKGYTLVTVLLMMVLMTTFGLVLASSVLSTAKQNHLTEEELQVTDLAEMGVTYFEAEFSSKLTTRIKELHEEAKSKGTTTTINLVKESNYVISTLQKSHLIDSIDNTSFHFNLVVNNIEDSSTGVVVTYTSTGCINECSSSNKQYSIAGKMTISGNLESNPGYPDKITTELLPADVQNTACTFRGGLLLTLSNCYINANNTIWNKDIHLNQNQTIHILGNVDVNTINFSSGGVVCVYGDLAVDDTRGNKHNSYLYAFSNYSAGDIYVETNKESVFNACLPHIDVSGGSNPAYDLKIILDDPVYN